MDQQYSRLPERTYDLAAMIANERWNAAQRQNARPECRSMATSPLTPIRSFTGVLAHNRRLADCYAANSKIVINERRS